MKRQNLRKGILLLSFLTLPITQFYFSPYLIIDGASKGILVGSAFTFGFFLVGSVFLGRAFCGWIMPCGGLQEACFLANDRKVTGGKFNWIKFIIWFPWISTILFFLVKAGGVSAIDPLYKTHSGISIGEPWMYSIYYGVTSIFVLLSFLIGRRASCHYICWMSPFMILGRKIRNSLKIPALQLSLTGNQCVHCHLCTKVCPMSLNVEKMVEAKFLENSECILCASCVDACKKQVLALNFGFPKNNLPKLLGG